METGRYLTGSKGRFIPYGPQYRRRPQLLCQFQFEAPDVLKREIDMFELR